MLIRVIIFFILFIFSVKAEHLKNCEWDNREGNPCLTISKTTNSSKILRTRISKILLTKKI